MIYFLDNANQNYTLLFKRMEYTHLVLVAENLNLRGGSATKELKNKRTESKDKRLQKPELFKPQTFQTL